MHRGMEETQIDNTRYMKHQLLVYTARVNNDQQQVPLLVDSGADNNFLDSQLAAQLQLPITPAQPLHVHLANNMVHVEGFTQASINIQGYTAIIPFAVAPLNLPYQVILGKAWHFHAMPHIDWKTNTITVHGCKLQPPEHSMLNNICTESKVLDEPQQHSTAENYVRADPEYDIPQHTQQNDKAQHAQQDTRSQHDNSSQHEGHQISQQPQHAQHEDISQHAQHEEDTANSLSSQKVSNINISSDYERHLTSVQKILTKHKVVFQELNTLPPSRKGIDHKIDLLPGSKPFNKNPYKLSPRQQQALKEQLQTFIDKGWVEPSTSPYASPILFVGKKDGSLRLCVDFRFLNTQTIRHRYPLPRQDELQDKLAGSCCFTTLDLAQGYHQVLIHPEDRYKTAFTCRQGLYQWKVLPFGLSNAPATFQKMMNSVLQPFLDSCVVVYMDDILIYSKTLDSHLQHLDQVLATLAANNLFCRLDKCQFLQPMVEYLGHKFSKEGVHVLPTKVEAILKWPVPQTIKELESFLGLANYYRRFICDYATISAPLTGLRKKNVPFHWTAEHQKAFEALKEATSTAPVLTLPHATSMYSITTDASEVGIGAVLHITTAEGNKPVAFYSRALSPAERNYPVHDLEMLAIITALQQWHCYLDGATFTVHTDHHSLQYFHSQPNLSNRQRRWLEFLSQFNLNIKYIKGKENVVADALSRLSINTITTLQPLPEFYSKLKASYTQNPLCLKVLAGEGHSDYTLIDEIIYKLDNGRKLMFIPSSELQTQILSIYHDNVTAGHPGQNRTYKAIKKLYYWPGIKQSVSDYVQTCTICQTHKTTAKKSAGLLQPLPIPKQKWECITMDFITNLPKTADGFDAILTVVDKLSKLTHFIPTTTNVTAPQVAALVMDNIIKLHGVPKSIISDRDPKFTSLFWKSLLQGLNITSLMSTSHHPQTDGQSERANQTIETMLRCYCSANQKTWKQYLAPLELAYNSSVNTSTQETPFFLNYGFQPLLPGSLLHPLIEHPESATFLASFSTSLQQAKEYLARSTNRMKQYADLQRRPLSFAINDMVMLSTQYLNLSLPDTVSKFNAKKTGPFRIIAIINPVAYKLELSPSLVNSGVHDVFHVSLLSPYHSNEHFTTRPIAPAPPVHARAKQPLYAVNKVLNRSYRHHPTTGNKQYCYLISWVGYGSEDNTWEPRSNLKDLKIWIDEYDALHPIRRGAPALPPW